MAAIFRDSRRRRRRRAFALHEQYRYYWYNDDFIKRNINRPTEADATNRNPTPVTTVTIPYSKGTSKTIARILHLYNIRVAHKPTTTLRHFPTNLLKTYKDMDEPNNRQRAV